MTIAAQQCRKYLEAKYPGVLISRYACRNTAGGSISQHSARGQTPSDPTAYDSNALDIFGPSKTSSPADQAYIQIIVDDLLQYQDSWSIRKILWKTNAAHQNHAHVDFYPMCREPKWCNRNITPTWKYSTGHDPQYITTRDPEPENGRFTGEAGMPRTQWHQFIDALFAVEDGEFHGDPNYWKDMAEDDAEWVDFWNAAVRQMSK